jgi:hypothetical protein
LTATWKPPGHSCSARPGPLTPPCTPSQLVFCLVDKVVDLRSDEQTLARMSLTICLATSTTELHPLTLIQKSSMFLVKSVLNTVTPVIVEVYKTLQYSSFRELFTKSRSSSSSSPLGLSHPAWYTSGHPTNMPHHRELDVSCGGHLLEPGLHG